MLGQVYLLAGKHDRAKEVYDEVVTINIDLEPMLRGGIEAFKTFYNLSQGEGQLALESASSYLKIQREFGIRALLPEALMLVGQSCLLTGELERAGDVLDESCNESQELGFRWPLWQTLATMASLEQKRGNQNRADQHLAMASEIFTEIASNISDKERRAKFERLNYWRARLEI